MMRSICIIAGRELRDGLRNRRVIATTLLLASLALTLALLGSAPTGTVRVSPLSITVVSLSSLTIFLVPLIALLIAHDAIAGEFDRGTMLLLLSYPVRRWQIIAGKFIGHVSILAFATLLGYGAAGVAVSLTGGIAEPGAVMAFVVMVGSSVLLGAAFIALGYVASVVTRDQRAAAGIALGLWLFFVLLYDMALLGLLVADKGRTITVGLLNLLLLANPADIYRLLNLTGFSNVGMLTGMAGLTGEVMFGKTLLVMALLAWVAVPLLLAGMAFSRRQI
jgi:Cu-processing system permease protein